ncbi:MAG: hypothetical protein ACE5H7_14000 [Acidiferrobacterales bacterium]
MALTVAVDNTPQLIGATWKHTGTIGFDTSYPTGGEALTAASIGLSTIDDIQFGSGRHGYVYYTDTALPASSVNVEILCPTGGAAPTSVADPSVAVPAGATAVTSTAAQPNLTETGGRGVELGDTADASSLTLVRFTAFGV